MEIPISGKKQVKVEKKASDMTIKEINEKIKQYKTIGVDPRDLATELHKRVSFSFSILTFTILGFGVSLMVRHREKSINFGIASAGALVYFLLFIPAETLIEYKMIPAHFR
jgi:lipopolysaccharide export LptBFGC system permease protein LptF